MSAAVETRKLTHRFGDREALSAVSLIVQRGEMVAVLGPNGGGKTTLFRILATLLRPLSGDAWLFGDSVVGDPGRARRSLGVVFQSPAVDPYLTARENLLHHGHLFGITGSDLRSRIGAALDALGIADRADERAGRLSGGTQRRVELAKVLVARPGLLLLDEPSAGLDPIARREFLAHLETLRRRDGTTVLLTTHLMEEAERCGKVAILSEGTLVAYDAPDRLKGGLSGQVVEIRARDPGGLAGRLAGRFGTVPQIVDGVLRLEAAPGHRLAAEIAEAFADEVTSVRFGPPTLEDVFVRLTGKRFEADR